MPAKKAATATRTRTLVDLPQDITSSEAVWPGHASGNGARNATLRQSLTADVEQMEYHSVRSYDVDGDKEQDAFLTLFRSVVKNVHDGLYGVQAVKQDGKVIVRLGDPVKRPRKNGTAVK